MECKYPAIGETFSIINDDDDDLHIFPFYEKYFSPWMTIKQSVNGCSEWEWTRRFSFSASFLPLPARAASTVKKRNNLRCLDKTRYWLVELSSCGPTQSDKNMEKNQAAN